jgi:hypothetical protein
MSTPKETAEAILIVIKRLMKWILIASVSIGVVIGAFIAYTDYRNEIVRKKKKEQEDKVTIVAAYQKKDCDVSYPYFYGVVNDSDKVVTNVRFAVEIRKVGFSNVLNSYTSMDEDKILQPKEGFGRCFRANKKDYSGELKEKDVEIVVTYKNVTFANESQ